MIINDDIDHAHILNYNLYTLKKQKCVFYFHHLTIDDLGDNLKHNFVEEYIFIGY